MRSTGFVARGGLWVLAQFPVMLLAFVIPIRYGVGKWLPDHPLAIAGVVLTVAGIIVLFWGLKSLGEALTPFPVPLDNAPLRRRGAYRRMRHPIYSGVMLASYGWALWWLSVVGMLYVFLVVIFFDRKAAHEEKWLRRKYRQYAEYERSSKKFIPGLY